MVSTNKSSQNNIKRSCQVMRRDKHVYFISKGWEKWQNLMDVVGREDSDEFWRWYEVRPWRFIWNNLEKRAKVFQRTPELRQHRRDSFSSNGCLLSSANSDKTGSSRRKGRWLWLWENHSFPPATEPLYYTLHCARWKCFVAGPCPHEASIGK